MTRAISMQCSISQGFYTLHHSALNASTSVWITLIQTTRPCLLKLKLIDPIKCYSGWVNETVDFSTSHDQAKMNMSARPGGIVLYSQFLITNS